MSVRIKLDLLSPEQKETIRKNLLLQPKNNNFSRGRRNWFSNTEKDPIQFYYVDKPNNEIVLPYFFGNALMGKHINGALEYPSGKYNFTGTLRDYQLKPNQEALLQLRTYGTTTLNYSTGAGKSISAAYLGSELNGLVLVMTNRKTIQKGWVSTFEEFTDAGVWVFDGKNPIPEKCNVILTMDGVFQKIPEDIKKLVSVFILDECHMFCTPSQVPTLLGLQPKYIITCTATLERKDQMHSMIHAMAGTHKVVCEVNKKFVVYKLCTGIMIENVKNKLGENNWAQLVKDHSNHPLRNAYIIDLIEQNSDHKIMVLTWNKQHVNLLYEVLKKRGVSVDKVCGNKGNFIDCQVLVGTISKMGTGFDAKNVATDWQGRQFNMLFITGSTKSIPLLKQMRGRAFRSDFPVIFDLVDENKIVKRHWTERRKEYLTMNCEIKVIKMSQTVIETENSDKSKKEKDQAVHQHRIQKFIKQMNDKNK